MAGTQRRLAAIVCADVVGYSRLIGIDEAGTLSRLRALRSELIDPGIAELHGRIVKTTGDGLLIEFGSVVDATRYAVAMQEQMVERNTHLPADQRIEFRIGIHMGDIVIDGDDILGDGVNVAARLEALAEPGGLCVSGRVQEDLVGKLDLSFRDIGEQRLKNIARPVRVWRWNVDLPSVPSASSLVPALELPNRPSIAVLPFANMSGDPDQEYFCDGVSEDIITELSRFRSLFVIARNSSFSYKGKSPDIREVGKELGVRYVVEGSIRRASNRIRVTAQLIDAPTGSHIWAERYDRVLEDVFAVQEELTKSIVTAVAPHIEIAEQEKTRRRRPESLSAYDIAVRAWAKAWEAQARNDAALRDEAIACAKAALAIDARSTIALNALAFAQFQHVSFGTAANRETAWEAGIAAANAAIELDHSDSSGYATKGALLAYASSRDRSEEAVALSRHGHELNQHNMLSLILLAFVEIVAGNPERAIEHLHQGLRISPRDPLRYQMHFHLAQASNCFRQYAHGVEYATLGMGEAPAYPPLHAHLAISYVGLGDIAKARAALVEARRVSAAYIENRLSGGFVYRKPEHQLRATTFLRIAADLEQPAAADALR